VHIHGDALLVRVSADLFAYGISELWELAEPRENSASKAFAQALASNKQAVLDGPVFTGPVREDWGYEYDEPILHDILDPLLESAEAFWELSANERFKRVEEMTEQLVRSVLLHWPDTHALQARSCAQRFSTAALALESEAEHRFGELQPNRELLSEILQFRAETAVVPEVLPPGIPERIARFLLLEYVRQSLHETGVTKVLSRWNDRHAIAVGGAWEVGPALLDILSWYSLRYIESLDTRRFLEEFVPRWRHGAPAWTGSVRPYLDFLRDCREWQLVCAPARNSLAEAVCRAWTSALNPQRADVFISYSHHHEKLARETAKGLSDRGLRVGFDRWEIKADATDRSVEAWIAETILRAQTRLFMLSPEGLRSGWVNREVEWDLRLLGVRRAFSIPLVVVGSEQLPLDLTAYPKGRVVPADLIAKSAGIDELALRVALDGIFQLDSIEQNLARAKSL
jgi:hypothetical protein